MLLLFKITGLLLKMLFIYNYLYVNIILKRNYVHILYKQLVISEVHFLNATEELQIKSMVAAYRLYYTLCSLTVLLWNFILRTLKLTFCPLNYKCLRKLNSVFEKSSLLFFHQKCSTPKLKLFQIWILKLNTQWKGNQNQDCSIDFSNAFKAKIILWLGQTIKNKCSPFKPSPCPKFSSLR